MGQVTHALLTRPPLDRESLGFIPLPFDLHVLGTPPAFILSQDQTLMFFRSLLPVSLWLSLSFLFSFFTVLGCSLNFLRSLPLSPVGSHLQVLLLLPSLGIFRVALLFICQGSALLSVLQQEVLSGNLQRLPTEKEGFEPSRRY